MPLRRTRKKNVLKWIRAQMKNRTYDLSQFLCRANDNAASSTLRIPPPISSLIKVLWLRHTHFACRRPSVVRWVGGYCFFSFFFFIFFMYVGCCCCNKSTSNFFPPWWRTMWVAIYMFYFNIVLHQGRKKLLVLSLSLSLCRELVLLFLSASKSIRFFLSPVLL